MCGGGRQARMQEIRDGTERPPFSPDLTPPPQPARCAAYLRVVRDRAGVSLFYLARLMGTSVEQIDKTYGHLLPDPEEYLRGLLDTFDACSFDAAEAGR
jgi:hypothetical protein